MTSSYHDPDTPPGAEAKLAAYSDQLDEARKKLREARDVELAAKEDRDAARRRAQFDSRVPEGRRLRRHPHHRRLPDGVDRRPDRRARSTTTSWRSSPGRPRPTT